MTVKHALESLKYTHRAIESYEGIKHQTIELYESVGYESDTLHQMISYTNERIAATQSHHDYWSQLIQQLEDDRYRDVLTFRYIDDCTVEEVAEKLFYGVRHINKLTNDGIKALSQAHHEA